MCVRTARLARAVIPALLATSLLSGCATMGGQPAPAALGAGKQRSIKDDPEPAPAALHETGPAQERQNRAATRLRVRLAPPVATAWCG